MSSERRLEVMFKSEDGEEVYRCTIEPTSDDFKMIMRDFKAIEEAVSIQMIDVKHKNSSLEERIQKLEREIAMLRSQNASLSKMLKDSDKHRVQHF